MVRYKPIDIRPRFLAVDLELQLNPGNFEHTLNYLIDHEHDLSSFEAHYRNDHTGTTAFPPALVLFSYGQGTVRLRYSIGHTLHAVRKLGC